MLKDVDEIIEVFDKLGLSPKSKLLEGRKAFEETVPKIVDALSALVGAATDSTNDILEVLRMLAYIKSAFPQEPTLEHAIGRALTLAFSSKPQIRNGIDKFFSETYFNKKDLTEESINRIAKLVQDAKVTDLVCIEEIMPRCARDKENLEKTALMVEQLLCEFENSPERLILYMIRLLKNDSFQMIQIFQKIRQKCHLCLELIPEICKFIEPRKCDADDVDFVQNFMMSMLLSEKVTEGDDLKPFLWFQAMEQALNVLYAIPDLSTDNLIKISIQIRDTVI